MNYLYTSIYIIINPFYLQSYKYIYNKVHIHFYFVFRVNSTFIIPYLIYLPTFFVCRKATSRSYIISDINKWFNLLLLPRTKGVLYKFCRQDNNFHFVRINSKCIKTYCCIWDAVQFSIDLYYRGGLRRI